jgi:hypothetical protein
MNFLKKIKSISNFIILFYLFSGCGRIENIENLNQPPRLLFNGVDSSDVVRDSVKISLKNDRKLYDFTLLLKDANQNIEELNYKILAGKGNLYQDNQLAQSNVLFINSAYLVFLAYEPFVPGQHVLEFIVIDEFNLQETLSIELTAFNNLIPIARFSINTPDHPVDPLERLIDASESYDQDLKFGGGVVAFEYSFLGKRVLSEKDKISVIFPSAYNYEITLRVVDTDGAWSEKLTAWVNKSSLAK